jgi:hypothetical protein
MYIIDASLPLLIIVPQARQDASLLIDFIDKKKTMVVENAQRQTAYESSPNFRLVRKEIGVVTRWPMLCLSSRVYPSWHILLSTDVLCVKGNE